MQGVKMVLLALSCSAALYGQSLEVLMQKMQTQNLLLQNQKEAITIADKAVILSDTWENPTLGIGANDLLLDDITIRDKEPMQTHFLTLSQKIPTAGKIGLKKALAKVESAQSTNRYHDRLQKLRSKLALYAYKVAIIDKKLILIQRYKHNAQKLKRLHTKRFLVGKSPQSSIEKSKILFKKLSIKERRLKTMRKAFIYKIEKLVYEKINSVEVALDMDKKVDINLKNHPIMIASDLTIQKAKETLALKKAKKIPDVKLGVGYFQRQGRSDYLSLNASMPLPVRNRENREVQIASLKLHQATVARQSLLFTLQRDVATYQELMQESKENYTVIKKEILPKKRYIQRLLQNEVFTKSVSITKLLDNLNETIMLELEAYDEMDRYYSAFAQLYYFQKDLS